MHSQRTIYIIRKCCYIQYFQIYAFSRPENHSFKDPDISRFPSLQEPLQRKRLELKKKHKN